VHDQTSLEGSGLPSVMVASSEFVAGAEAQSRALGFSPAVVWVQHPIQDRTDSEMTALADGAVDEIVRALTD
jgi:hypothetical protein